MSVQPEIPRTPAAEAARLARRLRRGALYTWAAANGISKIALGHVSPSQLADPRLFDFAGLSARKSGVHTDAHDRMAGYPFPDA